MKKGVLFTIAVLAVAAMAKAQEATPTPHVPRWESNLSAG
jgi:hypothetical protein